MPGGLCDGRGVRYGGSNLVMVLQATGRMTDVGLTGSPQEPEKPGAPAAGGAARTRASLRLVVDEPHPDGLLLAKAQQGDKAAFQGLVERHIGWLGGLSRRLAFSDAEADDVVQDTFVRLWTNLNRLEVGAKGIGPWLRRVATNAAMDRHRRRREESAGALERLVADDDAHHALEARDLGDQVGAVLDALPERQRAALMLFHYEGWTTAEVGSALDVSVEAVESLLSRARRAVRDQLEGHWRDMLPGAKNALPDRAAGRAVSGSGLNGPED